MTFEVVSSTIYRSSDTGGLGEWVKEYHTPYKTRRLLHGRLGSGSSIEVVCDMFGLTILIEVRVGSSTGKGSCVVFLILSYHSSII